MITTNALNEAAPAGVQALAAGLRRVETVRGKRRASGSITFSGNFNADDTVTINGTVFTAKASGATGNQFNIAGSLSLSLDALVTVLNASAVAGVAKATYAKSGTTILTVSHDAFGAAGNAFTLAASVGTPSGATLAGGADGDHGGVITPLVEQSSLITAAGAAMTFPLADGVDGQEKVIYLLTKGSGANALVTGTFASAATTLTLDTAGKWQRIRWMGGAWVSMAGTGSIA